MYEIVSGKGSAAPARLRGGSAAPTWLRERSAAPERLRHRSNGQLQSDPEKLTDIIIA